MTGVIGILLRASKENNIDLRRELDQLRESGFWISDDLYERALKEASTSMTQFETGG